MNEKIEEVLEKPLQTKLGIYFGSLLLLAGGFWYFSYSSVGEELSEAETKISELKQQVAEKRGIAANLGRFESEVARLDAELSRALRELPDKREIDRLLDRISDKARDAGLEIRLFQPQGERLQDFYAEVPVSIEVLGTFHQLASFFDEVSHLSRVVNVEDFKMGTPQTSDKGMLLDTSVVMTSFRFLDESERPKSEQDGKRKKRRK